MISVFTEQPTSIFLIGAVAVVIALIALIKTGRFGFVYVAVGLALLTAAALFAERRIVTPREELRGVLLAISADLAADDIPAVLNYFAADAEEYQKRAERLFKQYRVNRVVIKNNLEVAPKEGHDDRVVATFNAVGVVSGRNGSITEQPAPQFMTVEFVREGGNWRISDYDRQQPHRGGR